LGRIPDALASGIIHPAQGDVAMKKLALNVEELAVESFQAEEGTRRGAGTVHGHAAPDTQQFRCTYFCTYNCTGLPC
jgi:hypothetical protein